MTPEILLDGLAFPECPRWHEGALYFSDMHAGVVWRVSADGRSTKVLELPTFPGGLGWLADGTLQAVSMRDRRLLRLTPQGLITLADLSPFAAHPINDMVIDRHDRAYIGQFGFDLNRGEAPLPTTLLLVEPNGHVRVAAQDLLFPNGMVITPDGSTLILAETLCARLTAFDIQPDGSLARRRTFATLEGLFPDGICLDREGAVWVACPAGANRIVRVNSSGTIIDTIPLPGRDSFACMLGGTERCDLFVCTAQSYLPEETRKACAGRIEVIRVTVPGAGLP